MIRVKVRSNMTIPLGREGENLAREIVFDISDWQAEYGLGTVSLIAQRPCDDVPYPCAITTDGSTVVWVITAADTAWHGNYGECELQYRVDDVLVKSETWCTSIFNAMCEPSETPPDAYQGWVDQVLQAGADAQTAAAQARENATAAEEDRQSAEDARDAACQSATNADASAKAAQAALQGMVYVSITTDTNGHIVIRNGDLLGTTTFRLIPAGADINSGHLEVEY